MIRYAVLLALLTTLTDGHIHQAGYCVSYGKCTDNGLPCVNNTAAVPKDTSETFAANLLLTCPHLSKEDNLCCSSGQLEFLMSSLSLAANIVDSCPACFTNFKAIFCDLACSPNQSLFVEVVSSDVETVGGPKHVTKFNHYLSNAFAKKAHKSCVDVSKMICGNWLNKCTLEDLFNYLGDNYFTTLKTDYIIGDDDVSPFVRADSDFMKTCNDFTTWDRCDCDSCTATCGEENKGQDGLTHAAGTCLSYNLASKVPQLENTDAHNFTFSDGNQETVKALCPAQFESDDRCCQYINKIENGFKWLDNTYGRCEHCVNNLKGFFCQYMCSEDQSLFTNILSLTSNSTDISAVQLVVSQGYLDKLNESCWGVEQFSMDTILHNVFKDVLMPTILVIDQIDPYELLYESTLATCNADAGKWNCPAACNITQPPTKAPTNAPTSPTTKPPTKAPTKAPTDSPTVPPTDVAPIPINGDDKYVHEKNRCLLKGTITDKGNVYPKAGNKRPTKYGDTMIKELANVCPTFNHTSTGCCTMGTLDMMKGLLSLAKRAIVCPICYNNLAKLFCNLLCNGDQSSFMEVTHKQGQFAVNKFRYYAENKMGIELHKSCKDDSRNIAYTLCSFSPRNQLQNEEFSCTYNDFIDGLANNPLTGFKMEFILTAKAPYQLDNPVISRCDESYNGEICGCKDCSPVCLAGLPNDELKHQPSYGVLGFFDNKVVMNNTPARKWNSPVKRSQAYTWSTSGILKEACPDFSSDMVTCNDNSIFAIKEALAKDHPYKACPKCFDNIRRYICETSCSPDQSQFIVINETVPIKDTTYVEVLSVVQLVKTSLIDNLHKSCSGIEKDRANFTKELDSFLFYEVERVEMGDDIDTTDGKFYSAVDTVVNKCESEPSPCSCETCLESCQDDGYHHGPNLCLLHDMYEDYPHIRDNSLPIEQDSDTIALVEKVCPKYIDSTVCCNSKQLASFESRVSLAEGMIGGCPACYANFKDIFCTMMCDPNQSQFMQVILKETDSTKGITYATSLRYRMMHDYMNTTYNSCKNVITPGGLQALSVICGEPDCDLDTFIRTLGDNDYTELKVTYKLHETAPPIDGIEPHEGDQYSCADARDGVQCSCNDCPAVCDDHIIDNKRDNRKDLVIVSIGVGASLLLVIVVIFLSIRQARRGSESSNPEAVIQNPIFEENDYGEDSEKIRAEKSSSSLKPVNTNLQQPSTAPSTAEFSPQDKDGYNTVQRFLRDMFGKWAVFIYDHPVVIVVCCFLFVAVCCIGLIYFRITTDPVELWTTPSSASRLNKEYFEATFGTPYRTAQVIFTLKDKQEETFYRTTVDEKTGKEKTSTWNEIFRPRYIKKIYKLQHDIMSSVKGQSAMNKTISLSDVCYKPLGDHNNTHPVRNCVIQSPFEWKYNKSLSASPFDDKTYLENMDYLEDFDFCGQGYILPKCFGAYKGPIMTNAVFGGYKLDVKDQTAFLGSKAIILTFVLSGHADDNTAVMLWEAEFGKHMAKHKWADFKVSYSSDRALEDELDRASHADVFTIVISYILMFTYVSTTLGKMGRSVSSCFIRAKITIGLTGVVLVLTSVGCAQGVLSYFRLPATLVVIEVVPFLVLAVGVDNVYILVQSLQKKIALRHKDKDEANFIRDLIRDVMKDVGPSMLMSSTCQTVAFSLGALSSMPAVQNFAWNAALAVFIDFLLQITIFIVILIRDTTRELNGRFDCLCCLHVNEDEESDPPRGVVRWVVEDLWSKIVFNSHNLVRPIIVSIFGVFTILNIALIFYTQVGLDETMALPTDSHLKHYYEDVFEYLNIGPSVNFIFRHKDWENGAVLNVTLPDVHNELYQSEESLYKVIDRYSKGNNEPYITGATAAWMKKYRDWADDDKKCCFYREQKYNTNNTFCPSHDREHIKDLMNGTACTVCDPDVTGRSTKLDAEHYYLYLKWFLDDIPEVTAKLDLCVLGGKPEFGQAVKFNEDGDLITTSYFSSNHPRLSGSKDFIAARRAALKLCKEVNDANPGITVFPYSMFYHFYEQYDTIAVETGTNLVICIVAVFIVSFVMLGFQMYPSFVILLCVSMITIDMLGAMVVLGIPLNAISLVNLLMSVGIAVEFSAHIVKSYSISSSASKKKRAMEALCNTGPSIVSGITLTKFVGIVVLAFAKSKLFEVFYFRMFLSVIVLGATHALIFLPAFLSL